MPAGRPTKFKKEYIEQVYNLCLLGKTNEEISEIFEVSTVTLHAWMNQHPEFLNALKRGKGIADCEVVNALRSKALSGDTTACIFWLKNRQPKQWRDRREVAVEAVKESPFGQFVETDNKDGD